MNDSYSSSFIFEDEELSGAKICVIGVGGGGGNAVHNMVERGITGADFIVVNTDQQALDSNSAPVKIQAGRQLTKGLGAGARPSVGAEAVEESRQEIERALEGYDMVFITAGMGGGTGTGGAPVVAAIAKKLGILSVAIVTRPFSFEGGPRNRMARQGIAHLQEQVDTLIVVPNDKLLDISDSKATLVEAFGKADDVVYNATRGISDLITKTGLVNLDFADVKTTMKNGGATIMGAATASGDHRALEAATAAINSPLLDGLSIAGARNVLVNVTAGMSIALYEIKEAVEVIQQEAGEDGEVIFGTVVDDELGDEIRVTVVATGFDRSRGGAPKAPAPPVEPQAEKAPAPPLVSTKHVPVEKETGPYYKGEENLRVLDKPAHLRRENVAGDAPTTDAPDDGTAAPSGPPAAGQPTGRRVRRRRRVNLDGSEEQQQDRPGQAPDDAMPTFLRRQMD